MSDKVRSCHAEARTLGSCLDANAYHPDKCDKFVKALYLCCDEMYKKGGRGAESSACPMQSVVERWLKRHTDIDVDSRG
ncbi:DUF1903-domain-containing protein [Pisolithus orientalis]|uniref:DUF1903-domain-containing protein n=1 Tax=Pisolithus orientalis TaxID=936130 RepID=UPI002223F647|nr:DUF1903-domain-containing protein [Pisolithus orientalis]KAI5993708.1 DUF1903-domain-containing protein [Pisolithus orientalis]